MVQRTVPSFRSPHFVAAPFRDGIVLDFSSGTHPACAYGWGHAGGGLQLDDSGTHYGYVLDGYPTLISVDCGSSMPYMLGPGMFFSVPGWIHIEGGSGIAVTRIGYRGMFSLGGPIEEQGRQPASDGCSESLLIPPMLTGAPCLRHKHFRPRTAETESATPTLRIGIVVRGSGRCVVPEHNDDNGANVTVPLTPGTLFAIPPDGRHCFATDGEALDIIISHLHGNGDTFHYLNASGVAVS